MSDYQPNPAEPIIACDPSAISADKQTYWVNEIVPRLYKAVEEIQELPDGFAFRLPSNSEMLLLVAEDLNMERLCCPFVRYTLELEPNQGPFWLRFTGGEGVKDFLRMAFETANMFDTQVAQAAGFNIADAAEINSVESVLESVATFNERYTSTINPS